MSKVVVQKSFLVAGAAISALEVIEGSEHAHTHDDVEVIHVAAPQGYHISAPAMTSMTLSLESWLRSLQ